MNAQINPINIIEVLTVQALVKLVTLINNHIEFQPEWSDGKLFGNPFVNILSDDQIELKEGELATTMDDEGRIVFIGMIGGCRRVVYVRNLPHELTAELTSLNEETFNDLIEADGRDVSLQSFRIFLSCFDLGDECLTVLDEYVSLVYVGLDLHDQDTNEVFEDKVDPRDKGKSMVQLFDTPLTFGQKLTVLVKSDVFQLCLGGVVVIGAAIYGIKKGLL